MLARTFQGVVVWILPSILHRSATVIIPIRSFSLHKCFFFNFLLLAPYLLRYFHRLPISDYRFRQSKAYLPVFSLCCRCQLCSFPILLQLFNTLLKRLPQRLSLFGISQSFSNFPSFSFDVPFSILLRCLVEKY